MSYLINGEGSAHTDGLITHGSPSANRFAAHVVSTAEMDDITIIFQNGTVRELHAMPTFPPIPTRVTVSAADPVDVSDPLSFQLPTNLVATEAPNSMSVRRDSPRHMTIFPGAGSLTRAR